MPRPARHPQRRPLALAVACFALGAPPAPAQIAPAAAPEESGEALLLEELARRGARIGRIDIEVQNVFDTSNPDEAKRLYRWANRMHVTTRENVIENVLLFRPGDRFEPRLLAESARLLRSRDFLVEATVEPSAYHEETNTVDVRVVVRDGWSLSPELELGRNGGENELGIGIEESNLLGTGKGLTVSYSTDVDRDEVYLGYTDPNVRGSRARLDVVFANTSDGDRMSIAAGRPFFALDTRWSVAGLVLDDERVDTIYDLGEEIDEFRHERRAFSVEGGWSRGLRGDRALRWLAGISYEEHEFGVAPDVPDPLLLPPDRKLVYPWIGFQVIQDDFRVMTELNDIGRTEDVPLGLNVKVKLGFAAESFGADRRATVLEVAASKGWEPGRGKLFLFDSALAARRESGETRNGVLALSARYYHRNLEHHLFLASLQATASRRLDPERQVLLGGDNGLRGYPLRYQSGEHSAVLTLEQRFFTDWYPLRLFRLGYAVFFDVGRVWGRDARATEPAGTLANVGAGLRLTSPRSSSRQVVHIDLATPLSHRDDVDGWQLTVETKRSF
ncbi:MAG TPA: BamA/TamA family outer membrane protein [Gammaproteobacteria bacterium]